MARCGVIEAVPHQEESTSGGVVEIAGARWSALLTVLFLSSLASAVPAAVLEQGSGSEQEGGGAESGTAVEPDEASGESESDALSRAASDPTASWMAFNFVTEYVGGFYGDAPPGVDDSAWSLNFRPVIPFTAFGAANILRLTLPYQLDGRGEQGLGDVSLFDLVVFNEGWGRWGVALVATMTSSDSAPDDVVVGPALGGVWQYSKRLSFGLLSQNVFGGDTGVSQLQPIIAYQLGIGWSISGCNLQVVYDWERGGWINLPVGFQLSKVAQLAGQAMRLAVNPQYNLRDLEGLGEWKVAFTVALLVPASRPVCLSCSRRIRQCAALRRLSGSFFNLHATL